MENLLEQWHKLHQYYGDANYTTKELADYLKVSTRTIQRWLKGQAEPKPDKIDLLSAYLKEKATDR